jgi:ectoine hydroxylase
MRLTPDERARYRHDGFLLRRSAFAADELEELRATVEEVIAEVTERARRPDAGPEMRLGDGHRLQFSSQTAIQWEWGEGSQEIRLIEPFTHLHPRFEKLWSDARLRDPFLDMFDVGAVSPYTCKLNLKRPREGSEFPWHQDFTYWYAFTPAHAHEIGTVIAFLDDADADNGAIRVLPGSHRAGPAPRDPEDPTTFLADPRRIDAAAERVIAAEAGSLLFFPSLLLHRSSPNASGRQRRAILLSFQPAGRPLQIELEWKPERVDDLR